MCGKSFILVKPDGVELDLVDKIIQKIKEKDILVVEQQEIYLDYLDILNLWPYTQSDIVSRQLFLDYLVGKKCILLQLEFWEYSMHSDILEIKNYFRKKYGQHQFLSVIHSPVTYEEYIKDINIFKKKVKNLVTNKTIIGKFNCYNELNKKNVDILCKEIQRYLNYDYEYWIREYAIDKSFLVVQKNGINDSYFLVGILGDYLKYSLGLCYYLAFSINYFGCFPIMLLEESKSNLSYITVVLEKYAYKTLIMKGNEFLNGTIG